MRIGTWTVATLCCVVASAAANAGEEAGVTWKNHPGPFLDLKPDRVLKVRKFKAIPDDGRSDSESLRRAFEKAGERRGVTELRFEEGTYLIDGDPVHERFPFYFEEVSNLVINGNGAYFLIRNPTMGFASMVRAVQLYISEAVLMGIR